MDGFIGLSARRSNKYTKNLGIQKLGVTPISEDPNLATNNNLQVVGYFESTTSVTNVLGTGITSPQMYLKAGDVVYVMGCEGNIGSTTIATAATTFTNQGRVTTTWQPYLQNVATSTITYATYLEAAMLNARQNEWSPGNFVSTDWALTGQGGTVTLLTYKCFLVLKIFIVPTTGMYTINTAYGPRGTGSNARHVFCVAYRGVDTTRLTNTYYEGSTALLVNNPAITGTAGQFSCSASSLSVGDYVTIIGTNTGTGSISGYTSFNQYKVSYVTGTSPSVTAFTLTDTFNNPIVTTPGSIVVGTVAGAYSMAITKGDFVKSTKSRIATGTYAVGLTNTYGLITAFDFENYQNTSLTGGVAGRRDSTLYIGMVPEVDFVSDATNIVKNYKYNNWIGCLWTDQWDGGGGLNSLCGLDAVYTSVNYAQTYNHTGGLALTPSLLASTFYSIIVPSK
jgi:hypothetical protein